MVSLIDLLYDKFLFNYFKIYVNLWLVTFDTWKLVVRQIFSSKKWWWEERWFMDYLDYGGKEIGLITPRFSLVWKKNSREKKEC